jgi:hypothetical protein
MAITSSNLIWHYSGDFGKQNLPDPRTAIARHLQWTKPVYGKEGRGLTDWSTPEPDTFNSALFALEPIECPFVECQVWHYDELRNGWFSVYYIKPEQKLAWARWFMQQTWLAYWTVFKPSQLRKTRSMLAERRRKNSDEITLNERLDQQEYYSSLISKVEESAKDSVLQRIGKA